MIPVQITAEVSAPADKVRTCKASLLCMDGSGKTHRKEVKAQEAGSRQRAELRAVLIGLECMVKPSAITIKTDSGYVKIGFENLKAWKDAGWKNAKGKDVKNIDLWQRVEELQRDHSIAVVVI